MTEAKNSETGNTERESGTRGKRRVIQGVVSGDKMDQTISVRVERVFKHPKYKKYIRRHEKVHAHDAANEAHLGDIVELMECRPLSKTKHWRLVRVLARTTLAEGGA